MKAAQQLAQMSTQLRGLVEQFRVATKGAPMGAPAVPTDAVLHTRRAVPHPLSDASAP